MNSSGKVLILGASGGIGGEVARRLETAGFKAELALDGVLATKR